MQQRKTALIIGAGPAGLTAAYELLTRTDILPIVLEQSTYMGGISRTVNYRGNRIDIGGHRFFSKSDRVMEWWLSHLPMEDVAPGENVITYQRKTRQVNASGNGNGHSRDTIMLVRSRKSRIYFLRKLFEYPITLSPATLRNLGLWRTMKIGASYVYRALFPLKQVKNLEQFFINRFGEVLYRTFFKSYTEKVWGVPCDQIDAAWGEQRIKKLSIAKSLAHAAKKMLPKRRDVKQKDVETSLIERFLYPKFGPGQMWEEVARKVKEMGGQIITETRVTGLGVGPNKRIVAVAATGPDGDRVFHCDYCFSTMPIRELVRSLKCPVPENIREISEGLQYRDFLTVGLLLEELKLKDPAARDKLIADNWIYVQEPEVFAGRLQIFNNWSPWMVANQKNVWVGVEYFANEGDQLWCRSDADLAQLAADELAKIGIIDRTKVLDSTVLRMPKSYPAYFGTYDRFDELRAYIDSFENLFLVGRNGMHKYNNQDHSMLTAMMAVDNIIAGRTDKANLWDVNTEQDYHEAKQESEKQQTQPLPQEKPSQQPEAA